jgi:hypothetical protein
MGDAQNQEARKSANIAPRQHRGQIFDRTKLKRRRKEVKERKENKKDTEFMFERMCFYGNKIYLVP